MSPRGRNTKLEGASFGNKLAPLGQVWQCMACGKRSRDLYGYRRIDHGYDASCVLNAALVADHGEQRREPS